MISTPAQTITVRRLQPVPTGVLNMKLIGTGGTGGLLARPLSLLLASLESASRLVLIDGDDYDLDRNKSRMFCLTPDNKAVAMLEELLPYFVDTRLSLSAVPEYVNAENIGRLIRTGDLVACCVDNHHSRKLFSDHCATLDDVVLFSVGNDGVGPDSTGVERQGTFANVMIYARRGGMDLCPPLTFYHPEIANPADFHPSDAGCQAQIASTPQLLAANFQAASMMLSSIYLYLCEALTFSEAVADVAQMTMSPLPLPGPHAVR